ncbi:MAG: DUF86 domain-containing protein [Defluviitaleaceae bacterium]|nr:DUF86 domain-containing protein [Defluviitaleaceae bacterium]
MKKSDENILKKIKTYCDEICIIVNGITFNDFVKSENFRDRNSASFALLQIGELCKVLGDEVKASYADTKWKDWVFIRNFIAHNYDDFSIKRVWKVCEKDIPSILADVDRIINELDVDDKTPT